MLQELAAGVRRAPPLIGAVAGLGLAVSLDAGAAPGIVAPAPAPAREPARGPQPGETRELEETERARAIRWVVAGAEPPDAAPAPDQPKGGPPFEIPGEGQLFSPLIEDAFLPTYHAEPEEEPEPRPWLSFLPIWGDALREEGFDLPLPIGVSANYVHIKRDIDVKDIKVGINEPPKQSVSSFLQADANSSVDVVIGRVDVWLLPFLNVYAYGGWQRNDSNVRLSLTVPTTPPLAFTVKESGDLEGPVYGTGFAVAGGYEQLFATATFDFAFADFDEFDSRFEGRVYSVRAGWNGELFEIPTRAWSGFSYFDTTTTVDGSANVPGVGRVRFKVKQGPEHPWNGVLGLGVAVPYNIDLIAEYGFNFADVHVFTGGVTLRF